MYVVSIAQAWLGRSMVTPRSKYGNTGCSPWRPLVRGRRESASMPILQQRRHMLAPDRDAFPIEQIAQHGCPRMDAANAARRCGASGVYAVGDVRAGSVKRVGGAIGEGAAAIAMIHAFLARAA